MKYITLLLLLLPLAGVTQVFTFNLGPSFSTIMPARRSDPVRLENILTGLSATGGVDFAETKWRFLSANVGVVQKGRRFKTTYTDGNESYVRTVKTRFSYFTANFTVNFKLSSGKRLIPFASIGPRVDYFIDRPEISPLPAFLFGANAGLGVMQQAGNWRYGIRADYLYNITKKPDDRTATVMVFAGFKFPKKITPCPKNMW